MGVPYILSQPYLDANFAYVNPDTAIAAGTYGDSTHVAQVTINDQGRVSAVSSVAISGAANISATTSTTDATPKAIATVAVASNTTVVITVTVVARRTGGTSGTVGDGAGYILTGAAKNIAGTVTIIGQSISFTAEDQPAWTVDLAVATTNITVRVTGAADNNIDWSVSGRSLAVA